MIVLLRAGASTRRLLAMLAMVALATPAFGICLCDDEPAAMACHASAPSAAPAAHRAPGAAPVDSALATACCCIGGASREVTTLEPRTPELERGSGATWTASASAPAIDPLPNHGGSAARARWLVEASPPHAPPRSFVLPLRI